MKNNLTLLYVEDDPIIRENLTEVFKSYFENVIVTDNGTSALEIYENAKPDVIILDISIPGVNGLTVANTIRNIDENVVILIISAYSDKDKLLKAINLKLFAYLIKPVSKEQLNKSLTNIINNITTKSILKLSYEYSWNQLTELLYYQNKSIKLTKKESKIVMILINNANNYMNACDIQDELFNKQANDCNNIVQLISRLKKKLVNKENPDNFFIENCYGAGYRILINID